jgi:predicted ATP-grasp superfamily ATP-dependent carboligase
LAHSALALLQALQWDGLAMVEFKVDPSDGTATLMEVNGRYWGSISLPLLAGMDFPLYQWKLVHDEAPNVPSTYAVGTKWRWTAGCLSRYHGMLLAARRPGPDRDALRRELAHFGEDFGSSTRDALFLSSDPIPAIVELLRTVKDLAVSDVRRITAQLTLARRRGNQAEAAGSDLPTNNTQAKAENIQKVECGTAMAAESGSGCEGENRIGDRRR